MPDEIKINYGARTYSEIKADLIAAIDTFTPEWTDKSDTDMGIVLLKLMAYVGDLCMFHLGRLANEMNFGTAMDIQSMMTYAKLLNFPVKSPQAAITDMVVTLTAVQALPYTVPAKTRIASLTNPDIVFETVADLVIPAGKLGNEVDGSGNYLYKAQAKHWTQVTNEIAGSVQARADGTVDFLDFQLQFAPVIKDTVAVSVVENAVAVAWAAKSMFLNNASSEKIFVVEMASDGTGFVRFGNDVIGKVPVLGTDNVLVSYAYGGGAIGNDLPVGDIAQPMISVPYIREIKNVTISYGGADFQSVDELRKSIPYAWATMERAVTEDDFATLSKTYSTITKVAVGYFEDSDEVVIYPMLANGSLLVTPDKSALKNMLLQKSSVGTKIQVLDPYFVDVDISATFKELPSSSAAAVQALLETAVRAMFDFSVRSLGQNEYLSEVYRVMENVTGLNYANITKMTRVPLPVPDLGNAGKVTFTEVAVNAGTLPKVWMFKMISGTNFEVRSGADVTFGTLGTAFSNPEIAFTATAGVTPPQIDDSWEIKTSSYLGNQLVSGLEILRLRNLNVTGA